MDLRIISKASKDMGRVLSKNSPTILTFLGVGGLISTVIAAVKATPKATEVLYHEAEFRREQWYKQTGEIKSACPTDAFTPIEVVELTWKCYIPTAALGLFTIGCMVGSNHINLRRNAALASLLSIAETTLREYQAKVAEEIGDKKEERIRGEIAQDKLKANPAEERTIVLTGKGQYLCYDAFSSRYFRSDVDQVMRAENLFNQKLLRDGWLGINTFYEFLGLGPVELGDEYGWIAERQLLEVKKYTKLGTNDEPCLVIDYYVSPHHL